MGARTPTRPAPRANPADLVASPYGGVSRIDPVIHERVRLGIVGALAAAEKMRFGELKDLLGLTDGNLSVHARRLEEAGYVAVQKSFEGRVPKTEFRLTARGRAAFERWLSEMETLLEGARPRVGRRR